MPADTTTTTAPEPTRAELRILADATLLPKASIIAWREAGSDARREMAAHLAETAANAKKGNGGGGDAARADLQRRLDTLDRKTKGRGYTSAERKDARDLAGKLGVDPPTWARDTGTTKKAGTTSRKTDDPAREIARAAQTVAGIKTPIGATQARKVMTVIDRKKRATGATDVADTVEAIAGLAASVAQLKKYAKGQKVHPDTVKIVRAVAAETKDRLVWGRKCAAILVAIDHAGGV